MLLASEPSRELSLTQPRPPEPRGSSRYLYQSSQRQHSSASHSRLTGRLEAHLQVGITSPMTKKATCHPHWGTLWRSVWFMLSQWQAGEGTQLASEEEDPVMLNDPNKGWSRVFKHPPGHPHKWKTFIFMNELHELYQLTSLMLSSYRSICVILNIYTILQKYNYYANPGKTIFLLEILTVIYYLENHTAGHILGINNQKTYISRPWWLVHSRQLYSTIYKLIYMFVYYSYFYFVLYIGHCTIIRLL